MKNHKGSIVLMIACLLLFSVLLFFNNFISQRLEAESHIVLEDIMYFDEKSRGGTSSVSPVFPSFFD